MAQIQRLEPCGEEPGPALAEDVRLDDTRLIGQDRSHLLLKIRSGTAVFKALAFGMGKREPEPMGACWTSPHAAHQLLARPERAGLVLSDFASRRAAA